INIALQSLGARAISLLELYTDRGNRDIGTIRINLKAEDLGILIALEDLVFCARVLGGESNVTRVTLETARGRRMGARNGGRRYDDNRSHHRVNLGHRERAVVTSRRHDALSSLEGG